MKLPRPSSRETPPDSRPPRAVEFLQGEARLDEEVEFVPERDISEKDWEGMKGVLDKYHTAKEWGAFSSVATDLAILFPDRRNELNLDDEDWEEMKGEFKWHHTAKAWGSFSSASMHRSILFPDRRAELNLNDEAWNGMKGVLDKYHAAKEWGAFSFVAVNLTILAAQDARITSDGRIEITPKKPALSKAPPPLPERSRV